MSRLIPILLFVGVFGTAYFLLSYTPNVNISMQITSPSFDNGMAIPEKYTCDGENINPPLEFHDVPDEADSLVLIVDDPDVPPEVREDRLWVHWTVFNIPPETLEVDEGSVVDGGIEAATTSGSGYSGPCPPDKEHRYFFKLYALDMSLNLDEEATKDDIEEAMEGHILEKAELMGTYER